MPKLTQNGVINRLARELEEAKDQVAVLQRELNLALDRSTWAHTEIERLENELASIYTHFAEFGE